ncbi:trypsin-like peptidase domain-containing protein [Agrobacterium cavarae]|uniref:trypsin-like peptidase domain-containing protein n=1 Tax=Agrobacterium cavarae TaxID=2528239 RepID=UPI0028A7973D|nr:trypsin-like peptidase domain-containing protein [Agrobacterium cavarae]
MTEPTSIEFIPGHPLSYATTRIGIFCNDIEISRASGFTAKFGPDFYLVTNWHVASGRNPITNKLSSQLAAIPDKIKFHVTVITEERVDDDRKSTTLYFKPLEFDLYKNETPTWLEMISGDHRIDVALFPLNSAVEELQQGGTRLAFIEAGEVTLKRGLTLEDSSTPFPGEGVSYFYPQVGSEVFVLGYPKGIELAGIFPIWKRASIASEPQATITSGGYVYEDLLYIDALTKGGMSGSPVIAIAKEGELYVTDDGVAVSMVDGTAHLVGVYAGREGVTNEELEFSIGRVWKTATIGSIVMHKKHAVVL